MKTLPCWHVCDVRLFINTREKRGNELWTHYFLSFPAKVSGTDTFALSHSPCTYQVPATLPHTNPPSIWGFAISFVIMLFVYSKHWANENNTVWTLICFSHDCSLFVLDSLYIYFSNMSLLIALSVFRWALFWCPQVERVIWSAL